MCDIEEATLNTLPTLLKIKGKDDFILQPPANDIYGNWEKDWIEHWSRREFTINYRALPLNPSSPGFNPRYLMKTSKKIWCPELRWPELVKRPSCVNCGSNSVYSDGWARDDRLVFDLNTIYRLICKKL
jgi:hypothetical protein